ncbi:DEAD/DEAH box helicase family protein [Luteimonas sp. M1R5S18]|uniref:DEAD/DEAH box helicase family protein n=1 Tax=Luteimonas rhizosphaericola TaxID=3042024 RepID=A0ABT6JHR3_9GAMM|nr:DEAD/DEAH box helicase family protein [Luteimonas rhizosphaericola]MDH5830210.1 DEAD/DEAH box helicase family protein [Luteimonas rhizosphaericola]
MKFTLKDYQRDAVRDALSNLRKARRYWHNEGDKSAFSLTAATGAGKTVMAAAAFEALFHGDDEFDFDGDPGAVVIWFSDNPDLNEQTRFRLLEASDRISHSDMVVIEHPFSRPKFEPGKIYFLNTQKFSKSSLLVRGFDDEGGLFEQRPDAQAYTLWDTIQNTIEDPGLTLYLVLDEAHRGMGTSSAASDTAKSTIVQRIINGASGVKGIPVVWGISATVERFDKAIANVGQRVKLPNVLVDPAKVQESGLIKDTINLGVPDEAGDFDTVLVRRAADKLKEATEAWTEYARRQDESREVVPLLVFQVPNTPDPSEVGRWLDILFARYPELPRDSVANVFGEHTTQRFGGYEVPYIEPQRVQESTWVRVLIAKDAISTGWDCPRAEVMVSFRAASDKTHITQLLGRMVRTPLARRIRGNDRLNSVECLLPKFNRTTVDDVVKALLSGDDNTPPTGRILVNPVEMKPNPATPMAVWEAFEALPSQTRPQKSAKPAKRLTALAQELVDDGILEGAGRKAHAALHTALDKFQQDNADKISAKRDSVMVVDGKTVVADLKNKAMTFNEFWEDADLAVIDDAYRRATRIFSPDISRTYVEYLADKVADREEDAEDYLEAIIEARVTVAALALVTEVQAYFDAEADKLAKVWLTDYAPQIKALKDDRQEAYRQIIEMSAEPQDVDLVKPESKFEMTKEREGEKETDLAMWKHHLLCDKDGNYPAQLNDWERTVVETESKRDDFAFWYRNPQHPGQSSLGIAYVEAEQYQIVRPDFVFFSAQDDKVAVDLIDPHGIHLADALPKLRGLAKYAEYHAGTYRRIASVAMVAGKLRMLDLHREDVRKAIADAKDAASLFNGPPAVDYE